MHLDSRLLLASTKSISSSFCVFISDVISNELDHAFYMSRDYITAVGVYPVDETVA